MTSQYASFPVLKTISLRDLADVRSAADILVDAYEKDRDSFSFRILLPRGEKLTGKAKKLGMTLQGEFILTLRKRHLVPQVRDLRYVHDDEHYGWLLASPAVFERYERKS